MEFVAWAARVMHVAAFAVWVGGLVYRTAVMGPVIRHHKAENLDLLRISNTRFQGYCWMCAWTMLVTGAILMLLDPRFLWFEYDSRWSVMLAFKQIIFLLLVV